MNLDVRTSGAHGMQSPRPCILALLCAAAAWLGCHCAAVAAPAAAGSAPAGGSASAPGAPADAQAPLSLVKAETWAPYPEAAPKTAKDDRGNVVIEANGTTTCAGGWQFSFTGIRGGQAYRIRTRAEHRDVANPRDCLLARVVWDKWSPTEAAPGRKPWNYLLPKPAADGSVDFECVTRAPEGATCLTVRCIFRWSDRGTSRWTAPAVEPAAAAGRRPVTICIVNSTPQTRERISIARLSAGLGLPDDVAASVDLWGSLIQAACEREKPQLVVTPEVVIGGKDYRQGAIAVPGPATKPFEEIARKHGAHLVLGVRERAGAALHNSAVLVSPEGKVAGVYHKVHLATGEDASGITPGDGFPVFPTPVGRIGCLICMDTTVSESARCLALGGAEIICMPIMGDLRADRFSPGQPVFNESRWKAIMRTRAIDNQVCMVVARNNVQGSCIIDRKGDILAWNEGDQEFTTATLPADDGYRIWNGGDFREVTFLLRRPHLYRIYSDESNLGPLDAAGRHD
ncbi:MAG: carbon-nitrogen hydrolase family protein [Planctomycetes bacterium]|nr:carbon-nitrogen hydrolase family protein [Planctomycetota bacterium]